MEVSNIYFDRLNLEAINDDVDPICECCEGSRSADDLLPRSAGCRLSETEDGQTVFGTLEGTDKKVDREEELLDNMPECCCVERVCLTEPVRLSIFSVPVSLRTELKLGLREEQ